MLDGNFRSQIEAWAQADRMQHQEAGIPADAITCGGLVMFAVGCAVAIASGRLQARPPAAGPHRYSRPVDGAVAKASGTSACAWRVLRLGDRPAHRRPAVRRRRLVPRGHHERPVPVLAFAACVTCGLAGVLHPGQGRRARPPAAAAGLVERAERFILLGLGLLFPPLLVASLFVMIVLNLATVAQRFHRVWREAAQPVRHARSAPSGGVARGHHRRPNAGRRAALDARARARDRRSA